MNINICTQKDIWDSWLFSQNQGEFLQSWDWGEFQGRVGKEPLRLQATNSAGRVVWQAQGFIRRLGFGMGYLYMPRIQNAESDILELVLRFLKEKKYIFVRVEPLQNISNIHYPISIIGTRQPQHTLLLDISKSEEDLLSEMHAKTRYNIRLSEKKGVEVRQEKDVDTFWRLNEETSARDAFKTHDREYYARMLDLPSVFQLNAYYEGVSIASHIFVRFGDRFTYLHGASGNTHRNLMAPYLLQWEGIRFAEELGCQEYDFWGIAPPVSEGEKNKKTCFHELCWEVHHPWTGITRFKAGFGGKVWAYPEAVDIVLDAWQYRLYRFASYIQRYRAV